jgi:hypothetical protein
MLSKLNTLFQLGSEAEIRSIADCVLSMFCVKERIISGHRVSVDVNPETLNGW